MYKSNKLISACLVVYNEEAVIEKCLESIKSLVDEIIVVHDGICSDKTLEIAKKYTDKIFVRDHVGMMEAHLVYAFKQASNDWILRIDADEYFDECDIPKIKELTRNENVDMYRFKWEMWNGKKPVYFEGLGKECLFRKDKYHFCGIPHGSGFVDGNKETVDIFLHHRPKYNNTSWNCSRKKAKKWIPIHAKYFFPDLVDYDCFNLKSDSWLKHANKVTKNPTFYLFFDSLKIFLGQIKNGLWKSWVGFNVALQQYFYYISLYCEIIKLKKKKR